VTHTDMEAIRAIVAEGKDETGPLLPILHAIQEKIGFIPEEAVPVIAKALSLSRAEVHGTISFYHHFRRHRPARHMVQLCRAEACQARGGEALAAHVIDTLGCSFDGETKEGMVCKGGVSLEPVYCLGLCASGPAAMIDGRLRARLTPDKFDRLIAEMDALFAPETLVAPDSLVESGS